MSDEKKNESEKIEFSKGPTESPELVEEGRLIERLAASIPDMNICYSDVVRVAMDKQGTTQIQFGINDPYQRDLAVLTHTIYLGPRGMALLLRGLRQNYQEFLEECPNLAKELAMPRLRDLLEEGLEE